MILPAIGWAGPGTRLVRWFDSTRGTILPRRVSLSVKGGPWPAYACTLHALTVRQIEL